MNKDHYIGLFSQRAGRGNIKILQAELTQLFGTTKMIPDNFDIEKDYFIVKKRIPKKKKLKYTAIMDGK